MCEKRGSKFFISFLKCRSNPRVWNFKHYGSKWSKKEKNISSLNRHYPIAFQKFCTNLYSHKRSMRGSFLFLIFAKNWYNCLLCLTLNFRGVTMDLRLFFLFVLQKGITCCSPDPLVSFLFLPNSKFSGGAQTFLAWNTSSGRPNCHSHWDLAQILLAEFPSPLF